MKATIGSILINEALPEELRDYDRVWDKKTTTNVMNILAHKYPDKYKDVLIALHEIGGEAAYTAGHTVSLEDLRGPTVSSQEGLRLKRAIDKITDLPGSVSKKNEAILKLLGDSASSTQTNTLKQLSDEGNPLAKEVLAGARGNAVQLNSMVGSTVLMLDQNDHPAPIPVISNFSQGLSPAEYWAQSYGTRKGGVATKMCLSGDTRVLMSDFSEKDIRDIKVGDEVLAANNCGKLIPSKVKRVYDNGPRKCWRYRFRVNGCLSRFVTLTATEDHRILSQIREGRPGSTYAHRSVYDSTLLPLKRALTRKNSQKNTFVAIPTAGHCNSGLKREPVAMLYGLLLGDGCTGNENRIRWQFSCHDPSLLSDVSSNLAKLNLELHPMGKDKKTCSIKHTQPVDFIRETNGRVVQTGQLAKLRLVELGVTCKLAHEKRLAPEVYLWDDLSLWELIGGYLSCDGSIGLRRGGVTVTFATTSKLLAEDIRRVLELRLGVWCSSISEASPELASRKDTAKRSLWTVCVSHRKSVDKLLKSAVFVGKKEAEARIASKTLVVKSQNAEFGFKIQDRELVGMIGTWDLEIEHPEHMFVLGNGIIVANSTADAGYLSKQLALAAHRLLASDDEPIEGLGLPVDADDDDNVGAVLAHDVGKFKAGTVITPSMVKSWPKGTKRILVRSPISDISSSGGIPAKSLGLRERGTFPTVGEQVGIPAIQTITELLSQGSLNVKHSGGAGGVRRGGFPVINQLLEVPKIFPEGAAHSFMDGRVSNITDASQGGKYVWIGEDKFYVGSEQSPTVKVGDVVEAGDALSNGLPNPAVIVEHKGIGEGRKYFMELMRDVLDDSRMSTNRRNIEILSRAVVNHAEVTDETPSIPGALPGDIMEYDRLASTYVPRDGAIEVPAGSVKKGYLEKPVLHYSIGTRITPRVGQDLKLFGVGKVTVHPDPPPFKPVMSPVLTSLAKSPDWAERLGSFYIGRSFLDSVHRGGSSDLKSNSYIPKIIAGQPLNGLGQ